MKMIDPLKKEIASGKTYLGICLGLELLFEKSEEGGSCGGLGILKGDVVRFRGEGLKVPHIGWNQLKKKRAHPVFEGIADGAYFYFVHSYYVEPEDKAMVAGETEYGIPFCSVVAKDNLIATQFHPEKSGEMGLKVYDNFIKMALGAKTGGR